ICNYLPLKAAFILARIHSGVFKNSLGGKIAIWRVVLMQGMNGDANRRRARRTGKRIAECVVPFVRDANPIHSAQDDWLTCAKQDNASRSQAQVPFIRYRIVSHLAADGWCCVDVENGYAQIRGTGL